MTVKEALKLYPTVENNLLLAHALKQSKEFLFLNPKKILTQAQFKKFKEFCKRRLKGEPYAYIVGYKYFCGLKFIVNKNVLIPRPETEWLVEQAEQIIKARLKKWKTGRPLRVLDLGTGSGCIAISLAKKISSKTNIQIYAGDISGHALAVAKKNARLHHVAIKFIQTNLFKKIPGRFDLIIANLPYVPIKDYRKLYKDLKYEPKLALVGRESNQLYKQFFSKAANHLESGAILLLEIDPSYKKNISEWARRYLHGAATSFHKDIKNLWRYVVVKTALVKKPPL